jgi:predicted DNA-binding ribbon-helix-helix protein
VKRSIVLAGHKTSVLEDAFWQGLKDIAKARRVTLSDLVGGIDTQREHGNLSSALRLFVLGHYQRHTGDQKAASKVCWAQFSSTTKRLPRSTHWSMQQFF